jgi:hypothetical protein
MVSREMISKEQMKGSHGVPFMAFVKMAQERHTHETIVEVWTCATLESCAIDFL